MLICIYIGHLFQINTGDHKDTNDFFREQDSKSSFIILINLTPSLNNSRREQRFNGYEKKIFSRDLFIRRVLISPRNDFEQVRQLVHNETLGNRFLFLVLSFAEEWCWRSWS